MNETKNTTNSNPTISQYYQYIHKSRTILNMILIGGEPSVLDDFIKNNWSACHNIAKRLRDEKQFIVQNSPVIPEEKANLTITIDLLQIASMIGTVTFLISYCNDPKVYKLVLMFLGAVITMRHTLINRKMKLAKNEADNEIREKNNKISIYLDELASIITFFEQEEQFYDELKSAIPAEKKFKLKEKLFFYGDITFDNLELWGSDFNCENNNMFRNKSR